MSYYFSRSSRSISLSTPALLTGAFFLLALVMPRALSLVVPLGGIILMFAAVREKTFDIPSPRALLYPFLALVMMAGMSMLFSIAPGDSLERLSKTTMIAAPGLMLVYLMPYLQARAGLFTAAYALGLLLVTMEHYMGLPGLTFFAQVFGKDAAPVADNLNRNVVALALLAPSIIAMVLVQDKTKRLVVLIAIYLAALLWTTHSQSAQLAAVAMLAGAFLFPYGCRLSWYVLKAAVAGYIFVFPLVAPTMFKILPDLIKDNVWLQGGYAANRLEIWDYVSRYAMTRPFTGFGMESTRLIKDFDSQYIYQGSNGILHPHNFVLQTWIEFGAVGAAMMAALAVVVLRHIYGMNGIAQRAALATFLGALCFASLSYGMWQGWWIALLLLCAAMIRMADARINAN